MHAEHVAIFRTWLAGMLAGLAPSDSWTVTVPDRAAKAGSVQSVFVDGWPVRYTVQDGDTADDVAQGLEAASGPLLLAITPVTVTAVGAQLQLTSTGAFNLRCDAPLSWASDSPRDVPVVYSNQTAPQPNEPWCMLGVGQSDPESLEELGYIDEEMLSQTQRVLRVQQFNVMMLGQWANLQAEDVLAEATTPSAQAALSPLALRDMSVLLDVDADLDRIWAPRFAFSAAVAYAQTRRIDADVISEVSVDGQMGPASIDLNVPNAE